MSFEFSAADVAEQIDRFVNGRIGRDDWALFLEGPWSNPRLEKMRQECLAIRAKYPPKINGEWCSAEGISKLAALRETLNIPNTNALLLGVVLVVSGVVFISFGPAGGLLNIGWMQIKLLFVLHTALGITLMIHYFRQRRASRKSAAS